MNLLHTKVRLNPLEEASLEVVKHYVHSLATYNRPMSSDEIKCPRIRNLAKALNLDYKWIFIINPIVLEDYRKYEDKENQIPPNLFQMEVTIKNERLIQITFCPSWEISVNGEISKAIFGYKYTRCYAFDRLVAKLELNDMFDNGQAYWDYVRINIETRGKDREEMASIFRSKINEAGFNYCKGLNDRIIELQKNTSIDYTGLPI